MMYESTMKEPPNNPEIEAAFLACMFLEPGLMKTYADRVKVNYLYGEAHRKVYRAMRHVWSKDGALGELAVADDLQARGELDAVGGAAAVTRIAGATPSTVNHAQYADRVINMAKRRQLIANLEAHKNALEDGAELENVARVATSNIRQAVEDLDADGRPDDPSKFAVTPVSVAEWLTGERPPKREALLTDGDHAGAPPFLVKGKTAMLVAPGGGGKTGLLAQLAVAVASGTSWLGYNVARPGKVLLALGEEDHDEMQRRIYYAFHDQADQAEELAERVANNLVPLPLYATNPRFMELNGGSLLGDETPFYRNLVDYLDDNGPWALIIVDPASRFMGAEVETDNAAATRFVELLEAMTQVDGAPTVLAAHHTNKGALNAEKTNQGAARGSSALVDGVRWVANLELVDDPDDLTEDRLRDWRRFRVTKTNYTERPAPMTLRYDAGRGWVEVSETDKRRREKVKTGDKSNTNSGARGLS